MLTIADEGGRGVRQMSALADKAGRGARQMLTLADKGGKGSGTNDITDKINKYYQISLFFSNLS